MPEVADAPEVVESPSPAAEPVSESLRAAFAARTTPAEQPTSADATPTEQPPAATSPTDKTPPATKATDYGDLLKDLGVENVDKLKERWAATKDYDPAAVETLRANQRDDHDKAVRDLLGDPIKARAYFDLQSLQPETLATGTPDEQRQLLFENYKLANPTLNGRLAELGFKKEFEAKYALMGSEDPDDAEEAEYAKLQYEADLKRATPAVKAAQEAAKVALLPKPAEAEGPTQEQRDAAAAEWNKGVDAALAQPMELTVQVDGKPVKVAVDGKDAQLKTFLQAPEEFLATQLRQLAFPNGLDKAPDMGALAGFYGRLMQPDAIAKAAADAARASIGAHVSLSGLSNPAADAPEIPGGTPGNLRDAFRAARPAQ